MESVDTLQSEIKALIVEALALEDVKPEEIETDAPLFIEGLGLDSIDALELAMALEERYGVTIEDDPELNKRIFVVRETVSLASWRRNAGAVAEAPDVSATAIDARCCALQCWAPPRAARRPSELPSGRDRFLPRSHRAHGSGRSGRIRREGTPQRRGLRADVAALADHLEPATGGRLLLHCEDAYAFAVGLLRRWSGAGADGAAAVAAARRAAPARGEWTGCFSTVAGPCRSGPGRSCWHPLGGERSAASPRASRPRRRCCSSSSPRARPARHDRSQGGATPGGRGLRARSAVRRHCSDLAAACWPPSRASTSTGCCSASSGRSPAVARSCAARSCTRRSSASHLATQGTLRSGEHSGVTAASRREGAADSCSRRLPRRSSRRAVRSRPRSRAVWPASLGSPAVEVYGSTETGGIAVRQQWHGGEPWCPLPRVDVARDEATDAWQ